MKTASAPRRVLGRGLRELWGRLDVRSGILEPARKGEPAQSVCSPPAVLQLKALKPLARGGLVLGIASGKGGTGKTVCSVNLAVELARRTKTLYIDADLGLANGHLLLGMGPRSDFRQMVSRGRAGPPPVQIGPCGLGVVAGASGLSRLASLYPSDLRRLAERMDALVTEARVLVLDSAAGIAWQTLALLHASDYVVLVTTPETPALTDAYAVAKALLTRNPGRALGIVLNRVGSRRAGWETFERLSSVMWQFLRHRPKLLGLVEEDLGIRGSVEAGVPRVLEDPGGAFARSIKEVADNLLLETDTEESRSVEPYSARLCQVIAHRPRAWVRDGS